MDDDLTISLPDALRQRATTFAARRGETVENVVCEALEQYVTALAPLAPVAHNRPRTLLGSRLRALRSQVLAADEPLLDWEDLQRELTQRRGERDHAAPDLR